MATFLSLPLFVLLLFFLFAFDKITSPNEGVTYYHLERTQPSNDGCVLSFYLSWKIFFTFYL